MNTITNLAISKPVMAQSQSGSLEQDKCKEYYLLEIAWDSPELRAYSMSFELETVDEVLEMIAAIRENRLPIGIS